LQIVACAELAVQALESSQPIASSLSEADSDLIGNRLIYHSLKLSRLVSGLRHQPHCR
jgi:hypothetical protein